MAVDLPEDYWDYLEADGRDVGSTSGMPGYFQLWDPNALDELNDGYGVPKYAPDFIGFGSDGGGEMLAFDNSGSVYMIPFIGISSNAARKIADSWNEVRRRISDEKPA